MCLCEYGRGKCTHVCAEMCLLSPIPFTCHCLCICVRRDSVVSVIIATDELAVTSSSQLQILEIVNKAIERVHAYAYTGKCFSSFDQVDLMVLLVYVMS